jgi:type IV pilus assembly protein PilV
MLTRRAFPPHGAQRGVSLIEVAVAAAVLLCVAVGSMSLLMAVTRYAADSEFHLAAASLALEIAERMRLNRAAATAGDYDTPGSGVAAPAAASIAQADLQAWHAELSRRLPDGAGRIATQAAQGVVSVTVTVQWRLLAGTPGPPTTQDSFFFRL